MPHLEENRLKATRLAVNGNGVIAVIADLVGLVCGNSRDGAFSRPTSIVPNRSDFRDRSPGSMAAQTL